MDRVDALRAQVGGPRDGALLRYALGGALLARGVQREGIAQLRAALDFDATYSAAWNRLGKALLDAGEPARAADAWRRGIAAADAAGDVQAARAMRVFLKRIQPATD